MIQRDKAQLQGGQLVGPQEPSNTLMSNGAVPLCPLLATAVPLLAPAAGSAMAAMPRLAIPRGAVETDEHHLRPQGCRVAEGEGGQIKVRVCAKRGGGRDVGHVQVIVCGCVGRRKWVPKLE